VNRSLPLDALRGVAILLMVFSSRIPFGVLPEWMYHAQVPPPAHVFNGMLPGITWVDLVFPFFLFSMGAAIPLALSARVARGDAMPAILLGIAKRGAMLLFFAIYVKHIQPSVMSATPGWREWTLALFGFALLFPMLATLPKSWAKSTVIAIRVAGFVGAAIVLFLFRAKDGSGFDVTRSDIIILVLANVAVTGSLIWLATRDRLDWRIGILAFLFALRLTQSLPGWGQWLWNLSPAPWIGTVYFQQYLFIIIPGTIAGDLLLRWIRARTNAAGAATQLHDAPSSRGTARFDWALAVIGLAMTLLLLIGMKSREVVPTTIAAIILSAAGIWLARGMSRGDESRATLRSLFSWGVFLLLLGLAFEPYEGGIKKDRATMSYYFVTSGLAFMTLMSLMIVIEIKKVHRGFGLMIATGQNPLVAYAGVQSLLPPLLAITGLGAVVESLTKAPWLGALRGAIYTLIIAWAGAWCAKRGILLKT
jgi:predicted acyltransferase